MNQPLWLRSLRLKASHHLCQHRRTYEVDRQEHIAILSFRGRAYRFPVICITRRCEHCGKTFKR